MTQPLEWATRVDVNLAGSPRRRSTTSGARITFHAPHGVSHAATPNHTTRHRVAWTAVVLGPGSDEAKQVADVAVRLDTVQACAGEHRLPRKSQLDARGRREILVPPRDKPPAKRAPSGSPVAVVLLAPAVASSPLATAYRELRRASLASRPLRGAGRVLSGCVPRLPRQPCRTGSQGSVSSGCRSRCIDSGKLATSWRGRGRAPSR